MRNGTPFLSTIYRPLCEACSGNTVEASTQVQAQISMAMNVANTYRTAFALVDDLVMSFSPTESFSSYLRVEHRIRSQNPCRSIDSGTTRPHICRLEPLRSTY